jgi:hypothetical protein
MRRHSIVTVGRLQDILLYGLHLEPKQMTNDELGKVLEQRPSALQLIKEFQGLVSAEPRSSESIVPDEIDYETVPPIDSLDDCLQKIEDVLCS